ncbi:MAG: ABC transporter ATP-binding protein [Bacteriovoracaceae bacterium]
MKEKIVFRLNQVRKYYEFIGKRVTILLLIACLCGFFLFGVESSFVLVMQGFLLSIKIAEEQVLMLPSWYPRSIGWSVVLLGTFGLFRAVGLFLKMFIGSTISYSFVRLQRQRIMDYTLSNGHEISTDETINIFTDGVDRAASALTGIQTFLQAFVAAASFFIFGLKLAPKEMIVGIVLFSLVVMPLKYFHGWINSAAYGLGIEWKSIVNILLSGIKNFFYHKVYGLIENEKKRSFLNLRTFFYHYTKFNASVAAQYALPGFIGVMVLSFITYVGVDKFHTPGATLMAFFYVFIRMVQASSDMLSSLGIIKLSIPRVKDLYHWKLIIDKKKMEEEEKEKNRIRIDRKIFEEKLNQDFNLNIKNLYFRYDETKPYLFQDLNINLGSSDCFVIKGESGSGKSTLLSLILGMYQPIKGQITVNDFEINSVREYLYEKIAYVGPDPYLIKGTLRENLLYGNPNASQINDHKIIEILKLVQCESLLSSLDGRLNAVLNESAKLSTGQKQRLSMAKALLREPKLLIMDESTANLDSKTEKEIIDNLKVILKSITSIIVSHKDVFDYLATKKLQLGNG